MTGTRARWLPRPLIVAAALLLAANVAAQTKTDAKPQTETKPFEPTVGQAGKDVVWVPTPQALVDKMLELAKVTPKDFLMDLGSGDGRTVITAAKLGTTAMGIEYNPEMVQLAKDNAAKEGVSAKATFVKADLFETDFSKATVITMFLLPSINMKLRPKILDMKPGTRVASNTFTMEDWEPDQRETITNCTNWCTALLWIVPAKVDGAWQMPQGPLTIKQTFQNFTGTLGSTPIMNGKLNGGHITFSAGKNEFSGTVNGDAIDGVMTASGSKTNVKAIRSR